MKFATTINHHLRPSITRLDIANTILLIELEGIFHLSFVIIDKAHCLMMTNQLHAIGAAIVRHNLHIKIWRRFAELVVGTVF